MDRVASLPPPRDGRTRAGAGDLGTLLASATIAFLAVVVGGWCLAGQLPPPPDDVLGTEAELLGSAIPAARPVQVTAASSDSPDAARPDDAATRSGPISATEPAADSADGPVEWHVVIYTGPWRTGAGRPDVEHAQGRIFAVRLDG